MPKTKTFAEFLAGLTEVKRNELNKELAKLDPKITKAVADGLKASVAAGEVFYHANKALAKAGGSGQFSNYCRDHDTNRQTAYNAIRAYKWAKLVPAEFKAIAEAHGMSNDEVAQNTIIAIAFPKDAALSADAVAEALETAEKEIAELEKEPEESEDPFADAVKRAGKILASALKGQVNEIARLANLPKYKKDVPGLLKDVKGDLDSALAKMGLMVVAGLLEAAGKKDSIKKIAPRYLTSAGPVNVLEGEPPASA